MTREEARDYINSRPELVLSKLTRSKGRKGKNGEIKFICPMCGSGTHDNGTGALTYYPNSNRFMCYACSEGTNFGKPGQDVLGALRLLDRCTENEVFAAQGLTIDKFGAKKRTETAYNAKTEQRRDNIPPTINNAQRAVQELIDDMPDLTDYYKECRASLQHSDAAITYLQGRAISLDTAFRYWIGFDREADPADSGHPAPRIIMPTSPTHYVARAIDSSTPKQYQKMNNRGAKPGIFNAKVLQESSAEAIFVVEGIFDALSILEVGADAIALNSTSNAGLLLEKLQEKRTSATLILCLDNDTAGKSCTKTLREGLQRLNISYVTADVCGDNKDPNEHLQKDRESFTRAIREAERQTAARPDSVKYFIDNLMQGEIEQFKQAKDRKTGFYNLDEKCGGLMPGLYVVAAISSLGKTTLCHQIADNLAEAGEDVLYFSLEQSRLELVSKSLARKSALLSLKKYGNYKGALNSLSIRQGYSTDTSKQAALEYNAAIADRLSIIEGNFSCNISFIGDYIRRYTQKNGKKPVIFIDYLQILMPEQDEKGRTQTTKETVDSTVTELKRISRELGLTVFVISSVNRANYLTPIDFESLKESGGIEYTADVIWGLQLQCLNDALFDAGAKDKIKAKRERIKAEKKASPRKIELVCLKNRYGISSYSDYFDYYPEYDLFREGTKADAEGRPASTFQKYGGRI